ncbi:MAG: ABC transporter ATP-binding protein [Defluviitaleaceae bacterium]|nr:ABC transporter ATP-binding protein [Defluviitaleaceae bacterium]
MIKVQNIEKHFGEQTVLRGVNFEVRHKEIFGLLGPSGSGKTTLINILTNQIEADGGYAHIEASPFETGLMLDEDGLYPRISCLQNLDVFCRIYGMPLSSSMEALESVGLADAAKKPVTSLSKGMRQRLALARAILHAPKVLFLDEPTSALDPRTSEEMHDLIQGLRDRGSTIFLTTHNMEEAVKLCDSVALLHKGAIVEHGEPLEICNRHNSMRTVPDLGAVFMKMTGIGKMSDVRSTVLL